MSLVEVAMCDSNRNLRESGGGKDRSTEEVRVTVHHVEGAVPFQE
jgi:hypothetical protein